MKKILVLLGFMMVFSTSAQEENSETINWMSMEEAQAAAEKEPRKLIIDVYTDWCGWCKRMDKTTFSHPVVAEYVNKNFYAVKFNAEQKDSLQFKGKTFKYIGQGRRGYNELAALLLNGKMSYPSIVYLDESLNMIQPIPGYMDAKQFEEVINFIGDDYFKTISYEDFKKSFVSSIN